jgi:hypothetical protein
MWYVYFSSIFYVSAKSDQKWKQNFFLKTFVTTKYLTWSFVRPLYRKYRHVNDHHQEIEITQYLDALIFPDNLLEPPFTANWRFGLENIPLWLVRHSEFVNYCVYTVLLRLGFWIVPIGGQCLERITCHWLLCSCRLVCGLHNSEIMQPGRSLCHFFTPQAQFGLRVTFAIVTFAICPSIHILHIS